METRGLQEKHYQMTVKVNGALLCSHICLLLLFLYLKVWLMVGVNVGSIALYIIMFFLYKKSVVRYVAIVFVEVLIHMSLATISLGWDSGFQFYSFCLLPCIFLCDYLAKTDHLKGMHPIGVSVIVMIAFLACRWYCTANKALYFLKDPAGYTMLFAYNMILSFAFLVAYLVIFERRILSKEKVLEDMAEIDELTRLPNRYNMQQWLMEGFEKYQKGQEFAIAMIDVDDFKKLNDGYGHNCGDKVLKTLADKIQNHMEDSMHAARWGGEEFLFLNTGKDAMAKLQQSLEALRSEVEKDLLDFENQQIPVTITVGVTAANEEDHTFFDTIRRADAYMYQGKKNGKNRVISDFD